MAKYTKAPINFGYQSWGDRTQSTIVMLHGFMGRSQDFNELAAAFDDKYYCLAVDLPGHGTTTVSAPNGFDFQVCAQQLDLFMDSMGIVSGVLYGYSMGARLALHLALSYPDRWTGVILESGSPGLQTEQERELRINCDESLSRQIEAEPLDSFLEKWLAQPLFQSLSESGRRDELLRTRAKNDPHGLAAALRGMSTGKQPSRWEDLEDLRIPTQLITGRKDFKFSAIGRQMTDMNELISHDSVAEAGHNVHFERPSEFANLVRQFLNKHGSE